LLPEGSCYDSSLASPERESPLQEVHSLYMRRKFSGPSMCGSLIVVASGPQQYNQAFVTY
jgi:hypothetical protein